MKNSAKVGVAWGQGAYHNVMEALAPLDLSFFKDKRVLIKPNAGRKVLPESGIDTHPQAVAAVIDAVQKAGAREIAVGESPILGVTALEALRHSGIAAEAEKRGVRLIDMDVRQPVTKPVPNGRVLTSLRFCADIFDFDAIVSVPVAKSHMHTQVTLGIKNMKGCLWRHEKVRLHQLQYAPGKEFPEKTLDSAISDLAGLLLPDLTVVDAFYGLEGLGPSAGTRIQSDFSVASFNPLAADTICAELMGFSPDEIVHLRLIRERGFGSLTGLEVLPANFRAAQKTFAKAPTKIQIEFPDIVLHEKSACSACLSTTLLFLKRFASELGDYVLLDGKFHIGLGKDLMEFPVGSLLIGNCTARHKKNGVWIPGCPPVASKIYKAITGHEPETNEPDLET